MMSAAAGSAHRPAAPAASFLARRPLWQVSCLSGVAASVVVEARGLAARAAGVPLRAAGVGAHHAMPVTAGMFAMGTMVITFWFTVAVVVMARLAGNPGRTCLRTALPLLAASLAVPLAAAGTAISARLTLAAAQLIAGAIIIPAAARRLSPVRCAARSWLCRVLPVRHGGSPGRAGCPHSRPRGPGRV